MTDLRKLVEDTIHDELLELHSPADIADAVLAAIRESIGEDVKRAVESALMAETLRVGCVLDVPHALKIAAPILIAHARDAALEEAAVIAENAEQGMDGDYCDSCRSTTYSPYEAAHQIRILKGGPAHG